MTEAEIARLVYERDSWREYAILLCAVTRGDITVEQGERLRIRFENAEKRVLDIEKENLDYGAPITDEERKRAQDLVHAIDLKLGSALVKRV